LSDVAHDRPRERAMTAAWISVNIVTSTLARQVRERLWSEHVGEECAGRDPIEVVENVWRPALTASAPHTRPLRPLPAISRRSARLKGPLKGLLVDG
jgi:hypothetical protein